MGLLSKLTELLPGRQHEVSQEPQHPGPVSAPPGSQEASQAGESYKTPPTPSELWQAQRGETITSERPAERGMTNDQLTQGLNAEIDAAKATATPPPKPSPNTTSGTGEKAA